MLPRNEATSELDDSDTASAPKKGCSIWSLLVIMTLLAVWLALPRQFSQLNFAGISPVRFSLVCALYHHGLLWILVGMLITNITGKLRLLLYLWYAIVLVYWGPLFAAFIEGNLNPTGDHPLLRTAMSSIRLYDVFVNVYVLVYERFGYEPI